MHVQLILDKPQGCFTNLDVVSGRVLLHVPTTSSVSSVIVKLEGESRSRLMGVVSMPGQYPSSSTGIAQGHGGLGRDRQARERPVLEVHKVLYKTQEVWPPQGMQQSVGHKGAYTLNAGQYEWRFEFKVPFNNSCHSDPPTKNVSVGGLQFEVLRSADRHVKQTLPPSLNGFPGEAEIRYYVKVTVNRPQFYKENPRAFNNFTFLPIEPPRKSLEGETYARRQHQFQADPEQVTKQKSFLGIPVGKSPTDPVPSDPTIPKQPPRFSVDVRLPNPAVLTCNDSIPLKIIVKQLSERRSKVYLQMLQIELIGYTKVRAHELSRTESNVWVVTTMSNMATPLGSPTDPAGTEIPINPEYWQGHTLPNTVCPSFDACNISRYYELEVRVGLGYGTYEHGRDQLIVLPLRLPVKVYSGIAPPKSLLDAMAAGVSSTLPSKNPHQMAHAQQAAATPVTPSSAVEPPAPYGLHGPADSGFEDAPPSYEDAIAQGMAPIEGPRRDYAPPPFSERESGFPGDRKSR